MSIRSCTYSSNLTNFLPTRHEFSFFARDGRKCVTKPSSEIVHVRCSSIFEKWSGTIGKLSFGGCFTKHTVFWTQKIENSFSVRRKRKLSPATFFAIPRYKCEHNMGILSQTMSRF